MRFDLLALTRGQGVNIYQIFQMTPNKCILQCSSRFQANFKQTSSRPSIKYFVLLLGTSGGADSTCHLQYTEIMFGYKIQYLHNNIWPASQCRYLHNISSSSYSHKVGAATIVYAENLSTEQRTQMMSSPRITSVQGYSKRLSELFRAQN